jgi:pseudouridylate synthase
MWLARRAGVEVFATGGIGGVHRGEPRDVSADLTELARTRMLVVCAGAKSDPGPARHARGAGDRGRAGGRLADGRAAGVLHAESGSRGPARGTAAEVAALWRRTGGWRAGRRAALRAAAGGGGLPAAEVEAAIGALRSAEAEGVRGKAVTPFLLRAVAEATGGRSLEANVALLRNNARVAAEVAVALAAP